MELEVEMDYYKKIYNNYLNGARSRDGLLLKSRQCLIEWS